MTSPATKRRCAGCSTVITGRANRLYCSTRCRDRAKKRRRRGDSRSPVSDWVPSLVRGSNGKLLAAVARLGYLGDDTTPVLDVTPGREKWWTVYRPKGLVIRRGVDFRALPDPDDSWPVIAYDPPYISTGSRETSTLGDFYDRFGLGDLKGWRAIRRLIDEGLAECARILAPEGWLLVKCQDYTESGAKVWNTFHVFGEAERLGLQLKARFHHHTGAGAQPTENLDGSPREQRLPREVTSMLFVFTKPRV